MTFRRLPMLMDPYDKSCGGYVLPQLPADIYTVSHEHYDHNYCEAVSNPEAVFLDGNRFTTESGVLPDGCIVVPLL